MTTTLRVVPATALLTLGGSTGASADRWVGTWGASSLPPSTSGVSFTGFNKQTVRQTIHTSLGGTRVRLRVSNAFGTRPLRLDKVALAQPAGDRDVILLEGVNDIGFAALPNTGGFAPTTNVSADEITGGYKQIIAQAHRLGVRILGGTILTFRGSFYYTPEGEAKRQAVNDSLRFTVSTPTP